MYLMINNEVRVKYRRRFICNERRRLFLIIDDQSCVQSRFDSVAKLHRAFFYVVGSDLNAFLPIFLETTAAAKFELVTDSSCNALFAL